MQLNKQYYYLSPRVPHVEEFRAHWCAKAVPCNRCIRHDRKPLSVPLLGPKSSPCVENNPLSCICNNAMKRPMAILHPRRTQPPLAAAHPRYAKETSPIGITHVHHATQRGVIFVIFVFIHGCRSIPQNKANRCITEAR